jgi:hypothetical protein
MKMLKTPAVAVIAAISLAFCVANVKATVPVTTSYSIVSFSEILTTNDIVATATGSKGVIGSQKFVTKTLLNLLTNSDFAGTNFPVGSKLVIGWDRSGALLVVDKTGTNILYSASGGTGGNRIIINFYGQEGALSYNLNTNGVGNLNVTWHNNASFSLVDTNLALNLAAKGPCTEHFIYKSFNGTNIPTWADSQSFKMDGADETVGPDPFTGTLTGSITANGSGKGLTYQVEQLGTRIP